MPAKRAPEGYTTICPECQEARWTKWPPSGIMCRKCAALRGSAVAAAAPREPIAERLLARRWITEQGCWEWTGTRQKSGYGAFTLHADGKPKTLRVHRLAYEIFVGPIPEGLELDHLCRNRPCFNPSHLEPVTKAENTFRTRRAECVNGHPLTEENIYIYRNKRHCRTCRRERNRNRIAKKSDQGGAA